MGGLEGEVELLQGTPEGQVGHPCPGGQIPLSAGRHLDTQQVRQHVGVRHLLTGGRVESAVEHLDSLSQPQALHVLTRLLQGDHLTPPAAANSYTSRDRRSTSPADT